MKEWVDVVLEYGWAYGTGGTALKGKDFWLAATTGSTVDAYRTGAKHGHAFSTFLAPFEQTALLCGMRWLPPLIFHGARHADNAKVDAHVAIYEDRLKTYPHWAGPAAEAGPIDAILHASQNQRN
jgi:glutathione-regulated potassium-efflux system ancillary protein KefF